MAIGVVGDETLQVADCDGLVSHLEMYTLAFALFLLRAYTSTNGRQ